MDLDQVLEDDEQIETRYNLGDVEVVISNKRVIVEEEDELKSMYLSDITAVVLVKGDTYGQKEGALDKFLQSINLKEPPTYPIEVKFKAALPTARRMKFMTTTNYEDAIEEFHTEVNLKIDEH